MRTASEGAGRVAAPAMSRTRLALVHALLALLVGVSAFDIVTGREHWPFSHYSMYAGGRQTRALSDVWLYGVTDEVPSREIPLNAARYIQPYQQTRLVRALRWMEPEERLAAMADCLRRYERLREAGRHDGPALRGMRLYELHWELDPWARNVYDPSERRLIAAVGAAGPEQ